MPRKTTTAALSLTAGAALLAAKRALRKPADLTGETALVTGGSRGLGFLLARELGRAGCRVAICARDVAELDRAAADLRRDAADVIALRCDVTNRGEVERTIGEVTGAFGRLDTLVNNAGVIQVGPVETMTVADFQDALDVIYWGAVYPTLAALPGMKERRHGRIVTITSIGGKVAVPHLAPYTAAKFAVVGFSEGLRAELAGSGVSVTTIVPGLMRTGSYLNATFKGRQSGEFTWFGLGATLPLVSMDAERAARQVVTAIRKGEAERVLSVPATLLTAFHGLLPGTTADLLGLVNRLALPSAVGAEREQVRGSTVQAESPSAIRDTLTTWGRDAAERFHEHPGPVAVRPGAD